MLSAIELVPLASLAICAIVLRVGQYGWSVERIYASAVALLISCYAIGYVASLIKSSFGMRRLERTNLIAAYLSIALILVLFSPIADPSRIMVASQVNRLLSGRVAPARFDFTNLRPDNNGGRWGGQALLELSHIAGIPNAAAINVAAAQANAYIPSNFERLKNVAGAINIKVYPAGRTLPNNLFDPGSFVTDQASICGQARTSCAARYITLTPGGADALLVFATSQLGLFTEDGSGKWHETASTFINSQCQAQLSQAIAANTFSLPPHQWPDIVFGNSRFELLSDQLSQDCQK